MVSPFVAMSDLRALRQDNDRERSGAFNQRTICIIEPDAAHAALPHRVSKTRTLHAVVHRVLRTIVCRQYRLPCRRMGRGSRESIACNALHREEVKRVRYRTLDV